MAAAEQTKPTPPAKEGAASTKFYLVTADCYRHALGGWFKRGSVVSIPAGSKALPSQTWTEIDEKGEPVQGGQKAKPIAKFVDTKKATAGNRVGDANERLALALEKQTELLAQLLTKK